jgi:tRNA pseudouridine55 synthase
MISKTIKLYKEKGETPLQRLERFRDEYPEYGEAKLSYAGRLDPMAEGVLFVLVGDENKDREKHLKYSKEYTFEILFGFKTDSYDLLGFLEDKYRPCAYDGEKIKEIIEKFKGDIVQKYPPFSSKTVKGKPLFEWAKKGKLGSIKIPTHKVTIYDIKLLGLRKISKEELRKYIIESVMRVKGDFRQKEILDKWGHELNSLDNEELLIAKANIFCSSGTYVRAIAHDIGEKLGCGALAYSIKREDVKSDS